MADREMKQEAIKQTGWMRRGVVGGGGGGGRGAVEWRRCDWPMSESGQEDGRPVASEGTNIRLRSVIFIPFYFYFLTLTLTRCLGLGLWPVGGWVEAAAAEEEEEKIDFDPL